MHKSKKVHLPLTKVSALSVQALSHGSAIQKIRSMGTGQCSADKYLCVVYEAEAGWGSSSPRKHWGCLDHLFVQPFVWIIHEWKTLEAPWAIMKIRPLQPADWFLNFSLASQTNKVNTAKTNPEVVNWHSPAAHLPETVLIFMIIVANLSQSSHPKLPCRLLNAFSDALLFGKLITQQHPPMPLYDLYI